MKTSLLLFLLLNVIHSFSQRGSIQGSIIDKDTRTPISGVTVNLGNNTADQTDEFGSFVLTNLVEGQYELIASHVGYKTEIIPVEVKEKLVSRVDVNMKSSEPSLSEIKLNSRKTSGQNVIGQVDIMLRPVNTSQDILRIVPGIFIAQHAGGGKAEQIFLRGFDIDHGTDISLTADGMPVNMVSHAHGQGYADLHFVIPETIEKISFDFGPYNTEKGNLATAGYVDFQTRDFLKSNLIKAEVAEFNTQRIAGMMIIHDKMKDDEHRQFYVASEYFRSDNYFEAPQKFHRFNIMGKYTSWLSNQSQLSVSVSAFNSKWDASGQIPERAVKSGMITRFGYIDNTEGGNTGRYNFNIRYSKQGKRNWKVFNQVYYSKYDFNLFSNFTFFLDDPVNGDQINQVENRSILGYNGSTEKTWMLGNKKAVTKIGVGLRLDWINDVELSHTVKREFLSHIRKGDVREGNEWFYIDQHIDLSNNFSIHGGIRFDHFDFAYRDELTGSTNFNARSGNVVSPKLNFSFSPSSKVKLFINNGIGFHSNDSRIVLDNTARHILPRTFGTDIGVFLKLAKNLFLKATIWHLYSEQEFVYVGDAGIVEAGGETRRLGAEFSARYQFNSWLFADADINITKARAIREEKGEDYVPLAPSFTSIGGITARAPGGISGTLRYRLIGDRAANETNSITARGYFLADAIVNYRWKQFEVQLSLENIFNADWEEAQFDTESQLANEPDPVSEIHYTPGRPRFLKLGISFAF